LRGVQNLARQQDRSGAGAEDRLAGAELLQSLKEAVLVEELQHGGGFAAGQTRPSRPASWPGLRTSTGVCAGLGEGLRVAGVVALNGQDADAGAGCLGQICSPGVRWGRD
jgi:hypothetical protein